MLKTFLALALLIGSAASMVGCETTEGAGRDIKHAGQGIENAADRAK